ncbi:hypothetical protein ACWWJF_03730 [Symbiopectobacterium sp. Eva_TO]
MKVVVVVMVTITNTNTVKAAAAVMAAAVAIDFRRMLVRRVLTVTNPARQARPGFFLCYNLRH